MTRNPEKIFLLMITALALLLPACDSKRVFEEQTEVAGGIWKAGNIIEFNVPLSDAGIGYNVYLNVRNGREFPYSNLYLFMNTAFPDGHVARDTVELTLADYDGRWLGSGMGSVKFSRFLLKKGVRFKQTGNHRFTIEQAMRVNELRGIFDIGMRFEKE